MSLNISQSHSRSPRVIWNGTIRKLEYGFLFSLHGETDQTCRLFGQTYLTLTYSVSSRLFSYVMFRVMAVSILLTTSNDHRTWVPDVEQKFSPGFIAVCWKEGTVRKPLDDVIVLDGGVGLNDKNAAVLFFYWFTLLCCMVDNEGLECLGDSVIALTEDPGGGHCDCHTE